MTSLILILLFPLACGATTYLWLCNCDLKHDLVMLTDMLEKLLEENEQLQSRLEHQSDK